MKRAVIIGVDNVKGAKPLNAAVRDAKNFEKWARVQGFETTLITDEKKAVTSAAIYAAVRTCFHREEDTSQLIIYFAGHGLLKAPDAEIWLLSDGLYDPVEAVNLGKSIYSSRYAGIPHVVFISDCCRNLPTQVPYMQIDGRDIFPIEFDEDHTAEVDIFYATRPGKFAIEAPADTDSRGIFTECLLKGLKGEAPDIVRKMALPDGSNKWVVTALHLRSYLVQEVPRAIGYRQKPQRPEIRVESHDPKYLSDCGDGYPYRDIYRKGPDPLVNERSLPHMAYEISEPFPDENAPEKDHLMRLFKTFSAGNRKKIDHFIKTLDDADLITLVNEADLIIRESLKEDPDITTGLAIYGTEIDDVICKGIWNMVRGNNGTYIDTRSGSGSALIICRDGRSIPVAILDGFIGKLIFHNDVLMTVNYSPGSLDPQYGLYNELRGKIEERRALMVTLSGNGFRSDDLIGDAAYLRKLKALDPSLGLMAAYAYDLAGKKKDVVSVYNYIRKEGTPVIYDIALLARKAETEVHPFCPMMTRNWSYIREEQVPEEVPRHMVPGLWTTFTPEGTRILLSKFPIE